MATILGNSLFMDMVLHHEIAMREMYKLFSKKIPAHREFWLKISSEEDLHQNVIGQLILGMQAGNVVLPENRFRTSDIKLSLDGINNKCRTWEKWDVKKREAFDFAIHMEESIVEHCFALPFEIDDPKVQLTLNDMAEACKMHAEALRDEARKSSRSLFNLFGLLGG